jgi:maltooligosyltrehalose trehalohydrolase
MGEEYAETAPFPYFIDHGDPELVEAVRTGRAEEFGRDVDTFDPGDAKTFQRARLDRSLRDSGTGRGMLSLYRGLLAVRRDHQVLTTPQPLDFEAVATGSALTTMRRSAASMAFAAFNVGPAEASVLSNISAQRWLRALDSADPALGGDGAWHPEELGAAEEIRLAPYGFCLYIAAPAEGNAS